MSDEQQLLQQQHIRPSHETEAAEDSSTGRTYEEQYQEEEATEEDDDSVQGRAADFDSEANESYQTHQQELQQQDDDLTEEDEQEEEEEQQLQQQQPNQWSSADRIMGRALIHTANRAGGSHKVPPLNIACSSSPLDKPASERCNVLPATPPPPALSDLIDNKTFGNYSGTGFEYLSCSLEDFSANKTHKKMTGKDVRALEFNPGPMRETIQQLERGKAPEGPRYLPSLPVLNIAPEEEGADAVEGGHDDPPLDELPPVAQFLSMSMKSISSSRFVSQTSRRFA
eukprot:GHVT01066208.1.p1 GENE.GHVT01066208.1~~GHVT01066208.1.p1  ORF type:complete len:284 (+),score=82.12 GHVT01066208.1:1011-1862(+)